VTVELIGGISHQRPKHLETIFPFLRRALLPEPSSNRNPDRFDVVLSDLQVNPTAPTKVLDLGCGEWLLLEKLMALHHGAAEHLQAPCSYFGIDFAPHENQERWQSLQDKRCTTCFPEVEHRRFDLLQNEGLQEALQRRKPFDLIVLANVLHELPPRRGLELFELLFRHLTPAGKLVVIDPDWQWCFSPAAWTGAHEWHLEDIPVEWETDAVWLSPAAISDVLRSMGFYATVHLERRSMHFWVALGSRPAGVESPRAVEARSAMNRHLALQVEAECVRIARLRRELREHFRNNAGLTGELLVKTFAFFAACASQCRRLEALKELGP
jgi:SAM-dependent methyltransferase